MRVLVTGSDGYLGSRVVPLLQAAGHSVAGMDIGLYAGCGIGPGPEPVASRHIDVRDATRADVTGFDAVVHLAAISNDPLGDLNPDCTRGINRHGAVAVAAAAKAAGVARFVLASSCSLYGASGDALLDESAPFAPVTVYGESKVAAERDVAALADDEFSPTFLRLATVYGMSARLRGDLVVNNLVGHAVATGRVYIKSDGTPWRPLLHVDDAARSILAVLDAPRSVIHNQPYNVASALENYRIREVAEIVEAAVAGSRITFAATAGPDLRNYRVAGGKLESDTGFSPRRTVADGVAELVEAFRQAAITLDELEGPRCVRLRRVQQLIGEGVVDEDLRRRQAA